MERATILEDAVSKCVMARPQIILARRKPFSCPCSMIAVFPGPMIGIPMRQDNRRRTAPAKPKRPWSCLTIAIGARAEVEIQPGGLGTIKQADGAALPDIIHRKHVDRTDTGQNSVNVPIGSVSSWRLTTASTSAGPS